MQYDTPSNSDFTFCLKADSEITAPGISHQQVWMGGRPGLGCLLLRRSYLAVGRFQTSDPERVGEQRGRLANVPQ